MTLEQAQLIEKYNSKISGRYDYDRAKPLYRIPERIKCEITDYKIDNIIDLNL